MRKEQNRIPFCIAGILCIWGLLCMRVRFGFDQTDESYYYALAKRFCQGDIPLVDEWYPAQFFAVLLCPFYKLYTAFVPDGEGIILAGRYAYLVIVLCTALFVFETFRQRPFVAMTGSVMYMMCARQNIPGLSYYNLYMTFGFVAVILLFRYYSGAAERGVYPFLTGAALSVAVLCMPYLAVCVILFCSILLIRRDGRTVAWLVAGIAVSAAIYLGFLLTRAAPADYFNSLTYVLSNPDYAELSVWTKLEDTLLSLGKICILEVPGFVYLMYGVMTGKKFGTRQQMVWMISFAVSVAVFGFWKPGAVYMQFAFIGIPVWIRHVRHLKEERAKAGMDEWTGVLFFCAGLALTLAFWIGSDTRATNLPLGLVTSDLGLVLLLIDDQKQSGALPKAKWYKDPWHLVTALALLALVIVRIAGPFYRDSQLWKMDTRLEAGPAKGIYAESADAEDYNAVIGVLKELEEADPSADARILFTKFLPWGYLAVDYRNASMTPWRTAIADERLALYYRVHPEQIPDIVVFLDEEIGETNGLDGGEHMNQGNEQTGTVWDLISGQEYEKKDTDIGTVFMKKAQE